MRTVALLLSLCFIALNCSAPSAAGTQDRIQVAAEDTAKAAAASLRTCSANSADHTQSCNVTCSEGKLRPAQAALRVLRTWTAPANSIAC